MDWYPWYFTLYEQDTMHLDPYQDGCYRRLIDHYMKTRAPLPDNDFALARIVGDSYPNWHEKAADIVRAFFVARDGKLFHKRCDKELSHQDRLTKRLSESGKKGQEIRKRNALKNKKNLSPPDSPPEADPEAQDRTGQVQDKTGGENNSKHPTKNINSNGRSGRNVDNSTPAEKTKGSFNPSDFGKGSFDVERVLDDDAIMEARMNAPGWDIYHLMRVYNENIRSGTHERPKIPNRAFPAWCKAYTKGHKP